MSFPFLWMLQLVTLSYWCGITGFVNWPISCRRFVHQMDLYLRRLVKRRFTTAAAEGLVVVATSDRLVFWNFEVNSSNHKLWQISGNYEEKWIVEKQGDALWWFSRDWHWSPWWALVANTRLQWGTTLIKGNTLCFVKHFMLQRHCAIVQQSLQC